MITYESAFEGEIVATQKGLLGEIHGDLFGDCDIGEKHKLDINIRQPGHAWGRNILYLLNKCVGIAEGGLLAVNGFSGPVEGEGQSGRVSGKGTSLESTILEDLRDFMQDLDVIFDR